MRWWVSPWSPDQGFMTLLLILVLDHQSSWDCVKLESQYVTFATIQLSMSMCLTVQLFGHQYYNISCNGEDSLKGMDGQNLDIHSSSSLPPHAPIQR